MQHDALPDLFDIVAIEPDQLGSAECPREPDQQQCSVTYVDRPVARSFQHGEQIVPLQCMRFPLRDALRPHDTLQYGPHDLGLTGISVPGGTMRLGNGGKPPLDRRDGVAVSEFSNVARDYLGRAGNGPS